VTKDPRLPRIPALAFLAGLLALASASPSGATPEGETRLLHRFQFDDGFLVDAVGPAQPRATSDSESTEAPTPSDETPPGTPRGAPDESVRLGGSPDKTSGWLFPIDPVQLSRGSFSLWIHPNAPVDEKVYVLNAPPLESGILLKGQGQDRRIRLSVAGEGLVSSPGAVGTDRWHHLAATWDAETGEAALFLDGRKIAASGAIPANAIRLSPRHAARVGNWGPTRGEETLENQFHGFLYDLQIYGGRLSPEQVRELHESPGSAIEP
jgi:hypothetical protein